MTLGAQRPAVCRHTAAVSLLCVSCHLLWREGPHQREPPPGPRAQREDETVHVQKHLVNVACSPVPGARGVS